MGRNEKILRELFARFSKGGHESVIAELDENIVWRSPGAVNRLETAGEWVGRQGARAFFKTVRLNWTLKSLELREIFTSDDHRFVAHAHVATASNMTGKVVCVDMVHLVTMEDGKVTSFAEIFDTAPMKRASRL